jgi:hypothetical protein
MTDTSHDDRLLDLEIEKARLECEKLRAEIENERQPLWKRAGYIASLSPVLIAVATLFGGWVSGYFDTQRETLRSEIAALEATSEELEANARATQASIDDVYLQLKVIAGETLYAVEVLQAFGMEPEMLEEARTAGITDAQRAAVQRLIDTYEIAASLIGDSSRDLRKLSATLDTIPASDWALGLNYQPTPDGTLLFTKEGRVFDVEKDLFYDDQAAWERGQPSGQQKEPQPN